MVAPLEDVRRLFVEPKTQNGTGSLEPADGLQSWVNVGLEKCPVNQVVLMFTGSEVSCYNLLYNY